MYFGLYLHVARNLLYRGELRHTQTILRGLAPEVANDPRFKAIQERLWALREAQEHGSYVPAIYLKPDWWRYPKRLKNTGLTRWLAAKVASVSPDTVELDVADITPGAGPEYGYLELPLDTLAKWWKESDNPSSLEPGEFLEIGFYAKDGEHAVAVRHPRLRWEDLTLPDEDPTGICAPPCRCQSPSLPAVSPMIACTSSSSVPATASRSPYTAPTAAG